MLLESLLKATLETLYMISLSGLLASIVGIPLGFCLFMFSKKTPYARPFFYHALATIINAVRSIPYIILLVALIPVTRFLVGTSIGTNAALVSLTIASVPFLARLVEAVLLEIPHGLIEAAESMGATRFQLLYRVLWPEAKGGVINAVTTTLVSLVSYSAMAGAIGGGGLGDLAIRYGYQRFDVFVMIVTVVILIALVQAIQTFGQMLMRAVSVGR